MHQTNLVTAGKKIEEAERALIMVHGRGGNPEDILAFADHLVVEGYALLAPAATNNTWYPFSFMAPPKQNEPWLSSALSVLDKIVNTLSENGIKNEKIFFLGFSQGACLTLEYVTRNAKRWGGVIGLTGGLIGDHIYPENYSGNFDGTPVFIGSSDPDPHIPVERVHETARIMSSMQATVTKKLYPGLGHTINEEEIRFAKEILR